MLHYLVPTPAEIKLPAAYSGDPHALLFWSALSNTQGPGSCSRCHTALWQSCVVGNFSSTHCWGDGSQVLLLHHRQDCRGGDVSPQRMAAVWGAKSLNPYLCMPTGILRHFSSSFLLNTCSVLAITFLSVLSSQALVIAEEGNPCLWVSTCLLERQPIPTWEHKARWSHSIGVYFSTKLEFSTWL